MRPLALAALLFAAAGLARAADDKPIDDETKLKVVEYMLKTPLADAKPAVIDPFLKIDPDTLPKKLRDKTRAKQIEVAALLKLHDTKKKGSIVTPAEGCSVSDYVKPSKDLPVLKMAGYEEIFEDDEKGLETNTMCTETDLGCRFTMIIIHDKGSKAPRRLFMMSTDPLMAKIAAARAKTGGGNYFGAGITCMH